jgi:hypothetical protein
MLINGSQIVLAAALTAIGVIMKRTRSTHAGFLSFMVRVAPFWCLAAAIAIGAVICAAAAVAPVIMLSSNEGIAAVAGVATTVVGLGFLRL